MKNNDKNLVYKTISKNKKALYNYKIIYKIEAGIILKGTEIKSLRSHCANITDSYVRFENSFFLLVNSYIPEYNYGNRFNHDPRRLRKLLLNHKEIKKLFRAVTHKGITIIPLHLYLNKYGIAKIEIAMAVGKKNYQKRESQKQKDWQIERSRLLKSH